MSPPEAETALHDELPKLCFGREAGIEVQRVVVSGEFRERGHMVGRERQAASGLLPHRQAHRVARRSSPATKGAKYSFQTTAAVCVPCPRVRSLVGMRT